MLTNGKTRCELHPYLEYLELLRDPGRYETRSLAVEVLPTS